MGVGVAIGVAMDSIPMGIAIGAGMGTAIGAALEAKNKDKLRSLTKQEKRNKIIFIVLGVIILTIGILALLGILLLRKTD